MWRTKIFKTREQMKKWLDKHEGRIQYQEIFINNAFGIEWRPLRKV